ncbi:hypothetical protein QVD17_03422 [Tagetes erecta]|uniref:BHLH domain-containing protein n=1 Tax=Tagetes erecta TaxID=13708 RepID=A0AAD8P8N2_TARER|nr:hypothetical protein QVD17_03418 [Tagetes erecta]KAK1437628.1 hypothetical protein QVD17_03422 [Tagetes erecta]
MCSKREEQEEEAAVDQNTGYPSISYIDVPHDQNMSSGVNNNDYYSYTSEVSPILQSQQQQQQQQPWILHQVHSTPDLACSFVPAAAAGDHSTYLFPPPVPASHAAAALFNRRGFHPYDYASTSSSDHNLRLISETLGPQPTMPFGLQAEMGKMTAQEIMDAKALAASKSHSEAERRRRERINNHLAKLRSLLPSTIKTDKASLLGEVIQHVKELKRQTSIIAEQSQVPTEVDELTIDNMEQAGNLVIRASLCCEDRSDLLPDLIKTLKALRLRTLKAEITTLGGRMKNVLFITGDDDSNNNYCINMIHEAFKAVMEKPNGDHHQSSSVKRQRT